MLKVLLSAGALALGLATSAHAAPAICEFNTWEGGSAKMAQSWIGTGFMVQQGKSGAEVARRLGDKAEKWQTVRVKSASDFKTYIFQQTSSAAPGHLVNSRFSFRVYDSGKCQGYVETKGFHPIIARGKMK